MAAIRCGDHVHHRPSGEDWTIAYADAARDELSPAGWPDTVAKISDCELVASATDAEHEKCVRSWHASSGGRRRRQVLLRYGAAFGLALLLLAPIGCDGCNDGSNIISCSNACLKTSQPMASWSRQGGCVCAPAPQDGGAR